MSDRVETKLRSLRTQAPRRLREAILTEVGLHDAWTVVASPTGELFVSFNPEGISGIAPVASVAEFAADHLERTGRVLGAPRALPPRTERALARALATGMPARLAVDLRGCTEFQRAVLRKTSEIPPGEMRPYGWVAREIGRPGAVRAVGSALNKNPVAVVIPCHRVGRSDGSVGEYAFGPAMKRALLRAEGADPEAVDDLASRGVRFTGSDTTRIYCHPTCRNARRITLGHRVEFRSADAAVTAGYRGCLVCRPGVWRGEANDAALAP